MKNSLITITILFIVMASGHAFGQSKRPGQGNSGDIGAGVPASGANDSRKGILIGKVYFKSVDRDDSFVQDEMAPATRKRVKLGKIVTTNDVVSGDQCRYRDGGCIRTPFPPKKPKLPKTVPAYYVQDTMTPARKRAGNGRWSTVNAMFLDQCGYHRPGGCVPILIGPKKPKGPKTKQLAYYGQEQMAPVSKSAKGPGGGKSTRNAYKADQELLGLSYASGGEQLAKKKKEAKKDAKKDKINIPIFENVSSGTAELYGLPRCRRGGDRSNPAAAPQKPYCNQQQPWQTPGACNGFTSIELEPGMLETAAVDETRKKRKAYTGGSFYWARMNKH